MGPFDRGLTVAPRPTAALTFATPDLVLHGDRIVRLLTGAEIDPSIVRYFERAAITSISTSAVGDASETTCTVLLAGLLG
jgi:hypothetical protein